MPSIAEKWAEAVVGSSTNADGLTVESVWWLAVQTHAQPPLSRLLPSPPPLQLPGLPDDTAAALKGLVKSCNDASSSSERIQLPASALEAFR
jgi:hypothetical protein